MNAVPVRMVAALRQMLSVTGAYGVQLDLDYSTPQLVLRCETDELVRVLAKRFGVRKVDVVSIGGAHQAWWLVAAEVTPEVDFEIRGPHHPGPRPGTSIARPELETALGQVATCATASPEVAA